MKRAHFLKKQERAEASWDEYAESIRGEFPRATDSGFVAACNYLRDNPPDLQVVLDDQLGWKGVVQGSGESTARYILRLVQTVRNNLFHGGKYPYPAGPVSDVARNQDLLKASVSILEQCLILSAEISNFFEEAA